MMNKVFMAETKTILIIDDDEYFLEMISTRLEGMGNTCVKSRNGNDGFKKYQEHHPDLVLLDITMRPGFEGFATLRKIMSYRESKKQPRVVMLTASHREEDVDKAGKEGAIGYILKSGNMNEIIEDLRPYLES